MRNPYEVLGLGESASQDEIKAAYRKLARRYHPDVNPNDPEAEDRFKEVGQAFGVLSDPDKRARFDRFGSTEDAPTSSHFEGGFADLFESFFGGFGGPQGHGRRGRDGDDLRADVELTLIQVLSGMDREITYSRHQQCSECKGSGSEGGAAPEKCSKCNGAGVLTQVRNTFIGAVRTSVTCGQCGGSGTIVTKVCGSCRGAGVALQESTATISIPAGVETGQTMRIAGAGSDGVGGGRAGDLYVVLHVADDARFDRDGRNLIGRLDLTFAQATLGDELDVEGLDADFDVQVPAGTQPGQILRIEGGGLPPLHGGQRGDLLLQVEVKVPKKVADDQASLLRQFAEMRGEPVPKGEPAGGFLGGLFKRKK